jgi:FAD/FMN-containing dehydrogenase/Fe-S oxidoreductase
VIETPQIKSKLEELGRKLDGDLYTSDEYRLLYAVDASAYREVPDAVARPRNPSDIRKLVVFALEHNIPLIPRAAGTSLARQVVGSGIVVDISRYMTGILELNTEEKWVRVEPGVILDELNKYLEEFGLFFGPETSTSNRCMIGGMVGNNACGAHSVIYGSTRDHLISVKTVLSDGSEAEFGPLNGIHELEMKSRGNSLEAAIYRQARKILSDPANQEEIRKEYPDRSIKRRNTGYAIDLLLETEPFSGSNKPFNLSTLIAGSEGTLAFLTEIKLNLVPLPPRNKALICAHFKTLEEALQGNLIALKHKPGAVELMDDRILELTKDNLEQRKNRFFIKGDPGAILIIEIARDTVEEIDAVTEKLETAFVKNGLGYHYPVIKGNDISKVWTLRKSGLGVLSNMPGDAKPVSVIEDTAVNPTKLPGYIADFKKILEKLSLECVYHAHIATGELHLRPILNLKDPKDVELFRTVAREIAHLVKKYNGSLSGEHGDGRLRGEFIPLMVGEKNYSLLKEIKKTWDPANIYNPGKIVDTPPMNSSLRYEPGRKVKRIDTYFDFSGEMGILRAAERCNGSGDCRKTELSGGTMCPSYMATRDENTTTRARANILREILTNSTKPNPFDHKEIYEVMDLCLSCKGCKSECPSNVDIAKYKAEFLQHYYNENGIPLRTRAIAYITMLNRLGSVAPGIYNFLTGNKITSGIFKNTLGFASKRSIPKLSSLPFTKWINKNGKQGSSNDKTRTVYLFPDEFTEYNDTDIGIKAYHLLVKLGYKVIIPSVKESGRTFLSKGMLKKAKVIATENVKRLKDIIGPETPLIGIEPSAILSFRDEYPELVDEGMKADAIELGRSCFMIDEFLAGEMKEGKISRDKFTSSPLKIRLHGHCHQKALASTAPTTEMLSFPANYAVEEIPSGCCGMAGSFGYEKEHYEVSMKVGELVLFPEVRKTPGEVVIAAPGTSCRHQISDGTGRRSYHPVEILHDALNNNSEF